MRYVRRGEVEALGFLRGLSRALTEPSHPELHAGEIREGDLVEGSPLCVSEDLMRLPRFLKRPQPIAAGELFAGGDYSGLFAGWFLDAATADALAIEGEGAVPASELHVTVCYGGNLEELDDLAIMSAIGSARSWIECSRPMTGTVSGVGRFQAASGDPGDLDVVYAAVDVAGLGELNWLIRRSWENAGIPCSEHGFTAHITLAYIAPGSPLSVETVPNLNLSINELTISAGKFTTSVALGSAYDGPAVFGEGADDKGRIFVPFAFAEAPEWAPYLPVPGTYQHPRYGQIEFTRDRLAHFVEVFKAGSYQSQIPVDAEHETKTSGAVGWVTDMRQNADGSVDAKVEWTDRGRSLLKENRFKYVSAEFFDAWDSPTGESYTDVAVGMAICTRPFFKESVLRPLAASEEGAEPATNPQEGQMSDDKTDPKAASEPVQFAELQRQLTEEREARQKAEAERKAFADRLDSVEADARRKRFNDEVMGRSDASNIRWFGDQAGHITHLEALAKAFGEESDEVKHYVELNRSHATSIKESGVFKESGRNGAGPGDAHTEMERKVQAYRDAHPEATKEQAFAEVALAEPQLARKFRDEEVR